MPPKLKVSTRIGGKTIKTKRREFISAYMITINTNQRPQSLVNAQQFSATFAGHLDELFETEDHYRDGNMVIYNNDPDGWDKVISTDVKTTIELGENAKGGRIHSHTILKMRHTTSIYKIERQFIMKWFRERMGINMFVNVKLIPANVEAAEIYIEKTLDREQSLEGTPAEPLIEALNSQQ